MFYSRQVPGAPSKLITIVSGHHGVTRMGELVLLDLAKGRFEADGVVQRIPGRGKKVEPVIKDQLVNEIWPRFLHPHPLSEKYFIVSGQLTAKSPWSIYLADVFDNLVPIYELPGQALLEPLPLKKTTKPPVIPDRVRPEQKTATVVLTDVYSGPGLAGIPRGTVKKLRVFSYYFTYRNMGGHNLLGIHSGWDIKRVLGTVPVEADGSASFTIPANVPVAVQPLDEQGRSLQLMRSWFSGQPGEVVSCVGCHDQQNRAPPARGTIASRRGPSAITPWYGPARPFAFQNEVQPVLDRHCISCHDGGVGKPMPTLVNAAVPSSFDKDKAYQGLHPFIRRPGPESDYHLMRPMEYSASTSDLIQMLRKGHHGVTLDRESWERLYTWIDLNAQWRGTWTNAGRSDPRFARRKELDLRFACTSIDPEQEFMAASVGHTQAPIAPETAPKPQPCIAPEAPVTVPTVAGWPFPTAEAVRRQQAAGASTKRSLDLGDGVTLDLTLIPAGTFVMGDANGDADERPLSVVTIAKPFWMGRVEISNRQYQRFDPAFDARYIDRPGKDQTTPGLPVNQPNQPVARVTWLQSRAFCAWLSKRIGERVDLPTEAQWEWACRAGTASTFWFGDNKSDFTKSANLGDQSLSRLMDFIPHVSSNDGQTVSAPVGSYAANPWGLCDMHGNVAEWTLTTYKPYPYATDSRDDGSETSQKVVRGGSWRDRPARARSAFRLAYEPYQAVFNVGFRIAITAK